MFTRRMPPAFRLAFSLIELVIVVVIIGIVAAIAIPRMSRGSAGAAESTLQSNLAVLRKAIDLYAAEHGGSFPTLANIVPQLTMYSDPTGASCQTSPDSGHTFGPYLRAIPVLGVGARKGQSGITGGILATTGWVYDEVAGTIRAATTSSERDAAGVAYNTY